MVEGVQADLVAVPLHADEQLLVPRHVLPDDEKGGVHPPPGQPLQQDGGGGRLGPVVKGEGHKGPRRELDLPHGGPLPPRQPQPRQHQPQSRQRPRPQHDPKPRQPAHRLSA